MFGIISLNSFFRVSPTTGRKRGRHVAIDTLAASDAEERELDMEMERYALPSFGESPGGSPSVTPPSGQATPRRDREAEVNAWL